MRMLAVSEAATLRGMTVTFVTESPDGLAHAVLQRRSARFVLPCEGRWLRDVRPTDVVIFDGYVLEPSEMRDAGLRSACVAGMDDYGDRDLPVEIMINPSTSITAGYQNAYGQILAGPLYAPVRQAFLELRRLRYGCSDLLMVSLGSSDVGNQQQRMVEKLTTQATFLRACLVVGPGMRLEAENPRISSIVDPVEVATEFDRADALITAAGTTTWEALCMGLPIGLLEVASNQREVIRTAVQSGAAIQVHPESLWEGLETLGDERCQRLQSEAALDLVDGKGAARIVEVLVRNI